jgi:hypothetical protein
VTEYPGAKILTDFYPAELLDPLVKDIQASSIRRRELSLTDDPVPECLLDAARFASEQTGYQFNMAIMKWYRAADEYESLSYVSHRDPPGLCSIPLVLCTLTGEADFIYWDTEGREQVIRCLPNMVILLDSDLEHKVTPPDGPGGERFFLFLGFDTGNGEWRLG